MNRQVFNILTILALSLMLACGGNAKEQSMQAEKAGIESNTSSSGSVELDGSGSSASVSEPSSMLARSDGAAESAPKLPPYQARAQALPKTQITFVNDVYDFGKVPEGTKVNHQFRFKNDGEHPLHITRVKPSCGCTSPSFSEKPVSPGEEGFIDITFDSQGRSGLQTKTITVTGNFEGKIDRALKLKGEVE